MEDEIGFDTNVTSEQIIEHWTTYRTAEKSALIGGRPQADTKCEFRDKLGSFLCAQSETLAILKQQISLSMELMSAAQQLLEIRSVLLLDWDVVEEILCLRYIAKGWDPISQGPVHESPEFAKLQFQNYDDRRRFLLEFFEELVTVFETHIESYSIQLEEAVWFRDFLLNVYSCLIVEVFVPDRVNLDNRLFANRPVNFSYSVLHFQFVWGINQPIHAKEQRAPWIDRLLLNLISKSWPILQCTRNEINAALARQKTSLSQDVQFRFYADASKRYEVSNRPKQDIDLRYFGKSFERLLDGSVIAITEYLLRSGATYEDAAPRQEVYLLYNLLTSYVAAASALPQEIATKELYFPPPDQLSAIKSIFPPEVSVLPDNLRINPSRDVAGVYKTLKDVA